MSEERARLTRDDWAQAALRALARDGLGAVAVEPLARALGVTKGSFYWHFKNRDDLLAAALERWERVGMEAVYTAAAGHTPRERLCSLFATAFDRRDRASIVLHLTAAADQPVVRASLERMTARRLAFLADLYAATGLAPDAARHRALLGYSAYVGLSTVLASHPALDDAARDAYVAHLITTLVPGEEEAAPRVQRRRAAQEG